jgi:hypothetical protein
VPTSRRGDEPSFLSTVFRRPSFDELVRLLSIAIAAPAATPLTTNQEDVARVLASRRPHLVVLPPSEEFE